MRNQADVLVAQTDDCEREPIRFPGGIQPHGVLLCIDPQTRLILAASANHGLVPSLSGLLIGQRINDVWPELAALCGSSAFLIDEAYMVRSYAQERTLLVEIEPLTDDDHPDPRHVISLDEVLSSLNASDTLESLSDTAARAIRQITGMERILIYRFTEEGHGEVVAESKVDDWNESFIGFHFPAADIPAQARALYLTSRCRFMQSRDYEPVPIIPGLDPRDGQPFDLGPCQLRSLSPVHRLYQENLGVDGAMSVSIINEGRLWGLVVGHHRRPHRVPIPARREVLCITTGLSMRLSATETAEERDARAKHVVLHAKLLEQIAGADDFVSPLINGDIKLTDLFFASSGAAVVYRGDRDPEEHLEVRTVGRAPDNESVLALARACREHLRDGVFATDHTASILPPFSVHTEYASGVLAITVGEDGRHMIMWFRSETLRTTVWGGASPAQVALEKVSGNHLPRRSFARWVEEQRGHSRPWTPWKIEIARSLRTALNDVILRQMRTIRSLNVRLEESDQAKSRFLAHMSHELRTPLNAVLGFTEMLELGLYGNMEAKQQECLGLIREASTHLLTMINDVLDLSKIEAGKLELSLVQGDLSQLADRVVSLLIGMATEKKITVETRYESNLPSLMLDERFAKQMLMNLLSNAIKFTPEKGAVTVMTLRRHDGGLTLAVADTGIGIPKEKHAHVLEPFRQADPDMTHSRSGTGLGLPIVKSLIELHGGSFELESEPGKGTTVSLHFPSVGAAS
ncbi:putative signal transduction histidine kinase [Magnetospirillum sp. XM-1]|uniref:ATP-binding protein n=1 Tax=Magnetospirillum sp. XM-1 TaxID=1663591 RepID=UPI00073DDCD5|nr:ATP-binding protein [Magnetospirillum sp. XM-1]CUW41254.1 putative signal transduction histidine kinase [Magnetospirillum sp. XM-1]